MNLKILTLFNSIIRLKLTKCLLSKKPLTFISKNLTETKQTITYLYDTRNRYLVDILFKNLYILYNFNFKANISTLFKSCLHISVY